MSKISTNTPLFFFRKDNFEDLESAYRSVDSLVKDLIELRDTMSTAINNNDVEYIAQATQPTPDDGTFMIWKDTDATVGNSTHYLVYNDGGTVVTFASVEVVP